MRIVIDRLRESVLMETAVQVKGQDETNEYCVLYLDPCADWERARLFAAGRGTNARRDIAAAVRYAASRAAVAGL